ncbi:MAG: phosphoglycerate kinase [Euryarchaeota archaeon]|jgi:phosphoglycerate kinase|nr:phosphoglycerate kinase [Thermoplasmata archaeon]MVT13744.1 phosphoglycerate kinase [Euryarchaeota archaeon]MVT14411.1 phosphoglycerate kinase [Euryarchaeota archaeon]MVT35299.1 phosphoglycerate kinase [Euryarchaeota archaeon]
MKDYFTMDDFDLKGKRVLVRLDLNSPVNTETGEILDTSRFVAHLDTLKRLGESKVVIMAHQSRPGKKDFLTTKRHAEVLSRLLRRPVEYVDGLFESFVIEKIKSMKDGDMILLENTRFYSEDVVLADEPISIQRKSHIVKRLSPLFDYFINDAFAAIHRPQTTLVGFAEDLPNLAGVLMDKEITMLSKFLSDNTRPKYAILAGAKVDDSLKVAKNFLNKGIIDKIFTGGLVSNLFLLSKGVDIGKVNVEFLKKELGELDELLNICKELLSKYGDKIVLPEDLAIKKDGHRYEVEISELPVEDPIMDIGIGTVAKYKEMLKDSGAIILNGPMGVYEIEEFAIGTIEIFRAIADLDCFKVAGGGHTISVIAKLDLNRKFTHVSVGGGALINFLSGEEMPGLEALKLSKSKFSGVIK